MERSGKKGVLERGRLSATGWLKSELYLLLNQPRRSIGVEQSGKSSVG